MGRGDAELLFKIRADGKEAVRETLATSAAVKGAATNLTSHLSALSTASGVSFGRLGALKGAGSVAAVALGGVAAAAVAVTAAVTVAAGALAGAISVLEQISERGIAYNSQLEQTKLGIAAVVASLAELRDATGNELKGPEALNASLDLAADQLQKLRIAALQTTATFGQIAPAFQAAIGPGLRAGLTLDQVRETVVKITQAAGALNIPFNQLNQEVRAILEGTINEDARLAKVLGISNEMVKSWKEQGTLAEELNKRLEAFGVAGEKAAGTLEGLKSNFQEALDVFSGEATRRTFETLKEQFARILPQLFDFKAAGINERFATLASFIDDILVRVVRVGGDAVQSIISGLARVADFVGQNRALVNDILSLLEDTARSVLHVVTTAGGLAGNTDLWRSSLELARGVLAGINTLLAGVALKLKELEPGLKFAAQVASLIIAATPGVAAASQAGRAPSATMPDELQGNVGAFGVSVSPRPGESDTEKAEKIAAQARAGYIKAAATEAETAFQKATEAAKRLFDETGDLALFIGAMKKAESDRWKARQEQFDAERTEILKTEESEELRATQIRVSYAEQRMEAARHNVRMAELDRERTEKSLSELQLLHRRAAELDQMRLDEYVALQRHLAEQERITRLEANERINRETLAFFNRRLQALLAERDAAKGNADALGEINHQIKILKEQSEAFMRGDKTRIGEALSADAEAYLEKLTRALEGTKELLRLAGEAPVEMRTPAAPQPWEGPRVTPEEDFALFGPEGPPVPQFDAVKEAIQNLKSFATDAFSGIAQGFGQMVGAFAMGEKGAQSIGKMARAVIAGVAQMAAVKMVFELAEGFAALARAFFGDPKAGAEAAMHFKASAVYAGVAAVTAGIASAFGSGGGAGGGSAFGGDTGGGRETERDRTIREGRRGGASDPNVPQQGGVVGHVTVDMRYPDGHVEKQVVQLTRRSGPFRDSLLELAGQGPSPL